MQPQGTFPHVSRLEATKAYTLITISITFQKRLHTLTSFSENILIELIMRRAVGLGAINKKKLAEVMNLCYVSKPNVSL